jgi:NADH:ubiquinone oxidoreductase subunit K
MQMTIPFTHILIFTSLLFLVGLYGVLTRRNLVGILMAIEIMLNAVNINFVACSRYLKMAPETGQMFAIFIIVFAAVSAAVGLAIVLSIYRSQKTIYTDEINLLKW